MTQTDQPDALAVLEQEARRMKTEERAARMLAEARTKLVLGKSAKAAFFATLALKLQLEQDWSIKTMATDGKRLIYNPEFTCALSPEQAVAVVAHEVCHVANKHHARCGMRDPARWNLACDAAVNPLLRDAGFQLPPGAVYPGHFKQPEGLSAEEYYPHMPQGQGQQQPGDGPPDPGGCGGVMDPGDGSPAACRQAEAEAEVAVAQAAQVAKARGQLPGGLARLVQEVLAPKVDWREVLREFVNRNAKNDYSWSVPNRRFIWQGLYLPGLRSEELGEIICAVDTSGSIGPTELTTFASELEGILQAYDCSLTIVYCDAAIQHVQRWQSSDGPLVLEAKGGGGTDHRPVFEWIEREGLTPTCLVALTDLCSVFPSQGPDYPVLWCAVGAHGQKGPFGQTVEVS